MFKEVLDDYASASGQTINFDKSSIWFNRNVNDDIKYLIGNILGVRKYETFSIYLGLPSLVGRNKRDILGYIKNIIVNRVQS